MGIGVTMIDGVPEVIHAPAQAREIKNFCHEACVYNQYEKDIEGNVVRGNLGLRCELGYKQSVNSYEARLMSEANGTPVCKVLRHHFRRPRGG